MRVKTLRTLVAVTGMMLSVAAQAQDAPAGGEAAPATPPPAAATPPAAPAGEKLIGADVGLALPFGNWGDAAGLGIVALPRFEYGAIPNLAITGRIGIIYHLSKNDVSVLEVPILVGAKYGFTDAIYGAAEIGAVYAKPDCDGCESKTKLAGTIGVGYRMNDLDFRLGLHVWDLGHASDTMQGVLTVGYNFAKF